MLIAQLEELILPLPPLQRRGEKGGGGGGGGSNYALAILP